MSASSPQPGRGSRAAARVALAIVLSAFVAGCVPWELRQLLDGPQGKALSINPSATVVPGGGTLTFAADGGVPPYAYSMASGLGSVDPVTGFFTASASPGTSVVRVTDKTGKSQEATITVQTSGPLAISPSMVSVVAGSSLTFLPIGGSGSYSFAMQGSGSGSPSVTSPGGVYTAGSTPGTDTVRLTDTVSLTFVDATVTVTAVASTVNYTVSSVAALPASGTVASPIPAGTFTLDNIGSGNGQQTVTWELYLSADGTLGGGDWLVGSGTEPPMTAAEAPRPVAVSGSFPAVSPGPWNLIVQISAADDTTPLNNTSGPRATTLSALSIDYDVPAPGPTNVVGTSAGQSVSGDFTIDNIGTADGVAGIDWAVYASADALLDGADYLVARGSRAFVNAAAVPPTVPFSGYWPSTPGTWYLLATVAATDDVSSANNTTASSSTFTTTGPAPLAIDYSVGAGPSSTGFTVAGDPLIGAFRIRNNLADTGAQPVSWTAYLSPDAILDIGTDPVLDSGSSAAVAGSTLDPTINFGGTWPSTPGSWYLIVALSSSEDTVPGNNATASASPVTTTAPNVNYAVTSVGGIVGTTAGAAFSGNLSFQNAGTHAGTQFVPWSVYRSADAVLNIGTDQLVATGSLASPGLAAGAPWTQPFGGTWPASTSPNTYFLIGVVGAGDDVAPGNNTLASGGIGVNPPDVNYTVTSVGGVVGTTAGGAFSAQFSAQNIGTAGGTAGGSWTAYISSDATLDISDTAFQTGPFGPLGAGAPTGPYALAGTWPPGAASRWLFVKVSAPDDVNSGNDSASTMVPVTIPTYTVTSVPAPTGTTAGQAVSGTFTIQNTSTANGSAIINWTAYASLGNSTWDAGDTVIASGTTAALASGSTAIPDPTYAGTWPNVAGSYWVIVRAQAADASGTASAATGVSTAVSAPNVNYDVPNVTVAAVPRIPGQPVNGTFQYHNGGTNPGTPSQTVNWDVYASANAAIDGSDTLIASGTGLAALGAGVTSVAFPWAGSWPLTYGDYYILVRVSCPEDVNTGNNVGSSVLQTNVGVYSDAAGEPNNDYLLLTNPMPLGITLRPGMAVKITGAMDTADRDDIFQYNTGTANRVIVTVAWSIPTEPNVRIWYMTGPNLFASGVSGLSGSMSLDWVPDAAGTNRWIDLDNYWSGTDYTPPPNPSALTYTAWIVAQ